MVCCREPSIRSLKKAMQTYARQGGTSTIFINDDGLRVCYHFNVTREKMLMDVGVALACGGTRRAVGVLCES